MDFSYSKTEQLFLQMIRSFAENEVKPLAAEVDEQERYPIETVEKMGKLGLMGIPVPKQYGGAGGTVQMYIMAVEERRTLESVRHHRRHPFGSHLLVHRPHSGERHRGTEDEVPAQTRFG